MKHYILISLVFLIISCTEESNNDIELEEKGLIGHWSFDNGNFQDIKNKYNSSKHGHITLCTNRFEEQNKAIHFDGSSGYIEIDNHSDLNHGMDSFTYSMWIYPKKGLEIGRIFDNRGTGPGGNYQGAHVKAMNFNDKWMLYDCAIDDGTQFITCFGGQPCGGIYNYNSWYHIVMVYHAQNKIEYYINGEIDYVLDVPSDFGSVANEKSKGIGAAVYIKGEPGQSQFFKGKIDDFRIYNRTLSYSEIQKLYTIEK
jgi:hypothetical protein